MSNSGLSKRYLLLYNSFQFLGWALAFSRIILSFSSTKSPNAAFASAGDLIYFGYLRSEFGIFFQGFLQSVSVLEVVHAALGLVPSGVMLALMQWVGRTHFLLAVVCQIVEIQELPSVFITFFAWSASEIIRYSHYALNGIGLCPSWLTYLRYTAFILLYPIGVGPGEMWLMFQALPLIKNKGIYSNFFNMLPFSYHSFVVGVLVIYPFLWLKLYLHLFKQRRSKLGRLSGKNN